MAKRARLRDVIARREQWRDDLSLVRRLHADVVAAEGILSGTTLREEGQPLTNVTVEQRYAQWCAELRERVQCPTLSETERRCLEHFLHVTTNMCPRLFHCYGVAGMPRTNNIMAQFVKTPNRASIRAVSSLLCYKTLDKTDDECERCLSRCRQAGRTTPDPGPAGATIGRCAQRLPSGGPARARAQRPGAAW